MRQTHDQMHWSHIILEILSRRRWLIAGLVLAMSLLLSAHTHVSASPSIQEPTPVPTPSSPYGDAPEQLSVTNETCLSCHGQPGVTMVLENGEILDLYVPADAHANSVHGQAGYTCVQCHNQVGNYPHPAFTAADSRDASLKLYSTCFRCHASQYQAAQDSVHTQAQQAGKREAAVCTDCHTAHDVRRIYMPQTKTMLIDARVWIPQTCSKCHDAIYEKYRQSVHGAALIDDSNTDVPTCTDCHGSHSIQNPTTTAFRLQSPEMCAKCHTNAEIMDRYGLSTKVLDTYVADFHGTSLVLFDPKTPDAPFNKPVCYDCHGVHDIASKNDPQKSLLVSENLLARCRECHLDATANFPAAWLSHYIPSPEKYPIVYYVDLFYKFMIPVTLGGMAALVALDFSRMGMNKWRRRKVKKSQVTPPVIPATGDLGLSEAASESTGEEPVTEDVELGEIESSQELEKPQEEGESQNFEGIVETEPSQEDSEANTGTPFAGTELSDENPDSGGSDAQADQHG